MNALIWSAFVDELTKVAALDPEEQGLFEEVLRRHREFEQRAARGTLDEAGQAAMRDNVQRIKAFRMKSTGKASDIPGWAKSPFGKAPDPPRTSWTPPSDWSSRGHAGGAARWARISPRLGPALALGSFGTVLGAAEGASIPKDQLREEARTGGPLAKFTEKHPALAVGGLTGLSLGLVGAAQSGRGMIAGGLAPLIAYAATDKILKERDKRKKAA